MISWEHGNMIWYTSQHSLTYSTTIITPNIRERERKREKDKERK
jgi:hypothetical protein